MEVGLKGCLGGDIYMLMADSHWCISRSVSSVAQSCPTLCDPMNRSMPPINIIKQLSSN